MNFSNEVPDMKGKKKETVGEASEAGRTRSTYSIEESIALAHCWIEISDDPIVANNREGGFWGHITKRYKQVKPVGGQTHQPGDLCKHWNSLVYECAKFHDFYVGNARGFKYWQIYQKLKDCPKFIGLMGRVGEDEPEPECV